MNLIIVDYEIVNLKEKVLFVLKHIRLSNLDADMPEKIHLALQNFT